MLVTVDDDADLRTLAAAGRRLKGRAQSQNKGADIFLASRSGNYIGWTCHWRECAPGIRMSCDARNCGTRPFLHDDLDAVKLDAALVKSPQSNCGRVWCATPQCQVMSRNSCSRRSNCRCMWNDNNAQPRAQTDQPELRSFRRLSSSVMQRRSEVLHDYPPPSCK